MRHDLHKGETAQQVWENVFTPYRTRILYPVTIIGAGLFVPLAVSAILQGRLAIAAILLTLVAMLALDSLALYYRRRAPIPFAFLLLPGVAAVALTLAKQDIHGAFWSYPLVFLAFFVVRRNVANAIGVGILVAGTSLLALSEEFGTTLRYFLSLGLCLVVINIMLGVIESLHSRLVEQTVTDPLTGAFNRRHLDANIEELIERHRRTSAPASALLIDIDHFKRINDRLGHDAGDEVLKGLVALIEERRRKLDILFRQGGEEFVLLLPDTRVAEACVVAEKLRAGLEKSHIFSRARVTVSVGAGELHDNDTAKEWMKRLDEALYRAKEGGRNRVVSADPGALRAIPNPQERRRTA